MIHETFLRLVGLRGAGSAVVHGPTALEVGAGWVVWTLLSHLIWFSVRQYVRPFTVYVDI